jgi:hypothetical protein
MNSTNQVLVDRLNKVCSEYVHEVVMECGKLYGFEGSEALSRLGLSEKVVEKKKEKKINWESSLVEKVEKVSVEKKKEKKINWESSLVEKVEKVSVEKKGRPKKSKKELEVQGEDLFAELILSAQNPVLENPVLENPVLENPVLENVLAPPLVKVEVEQNAVEIPLLESDLVAVLDVVAEVLAPPLVKVEVEEKKVEKKVVVSKAEKEALKAAKEAEKAAKEAEKLALKEKKEAEKMAKKGDKKAVKKSEKVSKVVEKVEVEKVAEVSPEEVSEADVVKKFEYEGVKYLKSKKTGIIYNMDQEVVGKWNEESEKIDFEEEDDSSDEEE